MKFNKDLVFKEEVKALLSSRGFRKEKLFGLPQRQSWIAGVCSMAMKY